MTCTSMTDRMLEADLGELAGDGSSPLSSHLRECARCRAVAAQIVRDTRELGRLITRPTTRAVEVAARRQRVVRWSRSAPLGVAAAAVILIPLGWSRIDRASRDAGPASASAALPRAATPARAEVTARTPALEPTSSARPLRVSRSSRADRARHRTKPGRSATAVRATTSTAQAVTTPPIVVAAVDRAIPVEPVRLDPSAPLSLGTGVAVDPPPGTRVDIIRTSNPSVTVVWLYPERGQP